MRAVRRVGVALLLALALSTPAFAQSLDRRVSLNAGVGSSFANVGTTFSALADLQYALNDRTTIVGEFGMLRHAPFDEAVEIAPPPGALGTSPKVSGYHWNGNVKFQPVTFHKLRPYVTGGLGTFTADTIVKDRVSGPATIEDRRRVTDFSTNVGAGVRYPLTDWVGLTADYRTFFVHRDDDTPRVHRFVTGLTFSLK